VNLTAISTLARVRIFRQSSAGRAPLLADHGPSIPTRSAGTSPDGRRRLDLRLAVRGRRRSGARRLQRHAGGGLGVNWSAWGAGIQLLNSEPNINLTGIGKFAELSNFTVLPMVRFRWRSRADASSRREGGPRRRLQQPERRPHERDQCGVGVCARKVEITNTSIAGSVGSAGIP
jgi:hypothetical protein